MDISFAPSSAAFGTLAPALFVIAETLGKEKVPAVDGAGFGGAPGAMYFLWQSMQSVELQLTGQCGAFTVSFFGLGCLVHFIASCWGCCMVRQLSQYFLALR